MPNKKDNAYEFDLETRFQKLARKPGGISRSRALQNAQTNVDQFKTGFKDWMINELRQLLRAVPPEQSPEFASLSWIDQADRHSQRLADVAGTMEHEFASFVANNLCVLFEAMKRGAECRRDVITCHLDALRLAASDRHRQLRPQDLPELSEGLRRVLDSPSLQPHADE